MDGVESGVSSSSDDSATGHIGESDSNTGQRRLEFKRQHFLRHGRQ